MAPERPKSFDEFKDYRHYRDPIIGAFGWGVVTGSTLAIGLMLLFSYLI